jgi:ectoine hydroxylase-related dioxygenase (phytanoyl-CoA dioxygenase family)
MDPRQYKATISQNKAINKFLEEGYYVFTNVCEQGPIDIIVVNSKNGKAHYLDIKTSKGTRKVNGKSAGGGGTKLKTVPKRTWCQTLHCRRRGNSYC